MDSRRTHVTLGLALVFALVPSCGCARDEKQPNVILVVIDTLRSDRVGCYGYPRPTTPVIDDLARTGVVFEECVAQAPWTLQSMPSMFTGSYSTQHRQWPDLRHVTLAESFSKAGYDTFGLSANDLLTAELGYDRGFERYDSSSGPNHQDKSFDELLEVLWPQLDARQPSQGETKPLFLYLQPFDPHFVYNEHHEFDAQLPTDETEPVQPDGWQASQVAARGKPAPANDPGWKNELLALRHQRGLYDQEVRYADQVLGKLLDGLRARGLLEDAVVAIVSDHGEGLWEHVNKASAEKLREFGPNGFFFQGHAHHVYEEAIRTPFVLWGRGVPQGMRRTEPVENVDLFPTLCKLARVPLPKERNDERQLVGRDLTVLFDASNPPAAWREYTFAFMPHVATVREHVSGLKLIVPTCSYRDASFGIPTELFHLPDDPDERVNLATSRPADVERLTRVLENTIREHPTRTTWGEKKPPQHREAIIAGGYAGVGDEPGENGDPATTPVPPPDPRVDCGAPVSR